MKEETKKTLAQVSTATLTLQLLKRGIRNTYMSGVAPLGPMAERLVGEAVTLRFIPMREDLSTPAILADHNNPQRVAIDTVPAGAILVAALGRGAALGPNTSYSTCRATTILRRLARGPLRRPTQAAASIR